LAIIACYILKNLTSVSLRQYFATSIGLFLNFYVFGCTALVSLVMNILCYFMFLIVPRKHLPLTVFFVAGLLLAGVQIHK
jgi:hypothetical protein